MKDSQTHQTTRLTMEAADWHARLRAQSYSEIEAVRFRAWLARNPENRKAFESLDVLWDELSVLEHCPEVVRERAAIAAERNAAGGRRKTINMQRREWRLGVGALAGAILIAFVTFAWLESTNKDHYVTGVGEQRVIPLSDGSVITLNTATEVRLHYSPGARRVELLTGQANFEVAKDVQRPFIVTAGAGAVRAVGTIFDVYKTSSNVTVTLIEGKVAVKLPVMLAADRVTVVTAKGAGEESSPEGTLRPSPQRRDDLEHEIILNAGQQLSYAANFRSITETAADLPRASAWRARKLDFSDTPLPEAIAQANRYSRLQIELNAPELRAARISGTFEAGQNELFVEGLQTYFHLKTQRTGDNHIVLTMSR